MRRRKKEENENEKHDEKKRQGEKEKTKMKKRNKNLDRRSKQEITCTVKRKLAEEVSRGLIMADLSRGLRNGKSDGSAATRSLKPATTGSPAVFVPVDLGLTRPRSLKATAVASAVEIDVALAGTCRGLAALMGSFGLAGLGLTGGLSADVFPVLF